MNATADVIVVGGGAMGASISYHLADAGSGRVLLLERFARASSSGSRMSSEPRRGRTPRHAERVPVTLSTVALRTSQGSSGPETGQKRSQLPPPAW